ncbi:MAG: formate dehydrogenase accessory sulfurtransferase FdhD [Fusobacteriaceae bacterium]
MRKEKSNICMEAAVNLRVDGKHMVTFMCTPMDLDILSLGYLASKGLIKDISEVKRIKHSPLLGVDVFLNKDLQLEDGFIPKLILSGCGTGMGFDLELIKKSALNFRGEISLEKLKKKFILMLEKALMYKTMGGMHCAGLYLENGEEIITKEDIGRHNAVDKVIGEGLKKGWDLSRSVLMVTGRISSDMVFKSAGNRVPVIASRSITSDLALSLGEELGLTIIGRATYEEPIIYSGIEKIKK